jgi:hypothetical protein
MICVNCSAPVLASGKFCYKCGSPIEALPEAAAARACPKCGRRVYTENKYCTGCGLLLEAAPVPTTNAAEPRGRRRGAAAVACAVIIAAIGGGAFWFASRDKAPEQELSPTIPVQASSTASADAPASMESVASPEPEKAALPQAQEQGGDDAEAEAISELSEEDIIYETTDTLLSFYLSYLDAINEQDAGYMYNLTPELSEQLEERIFGVNSGSIFTFQQIIVDLDTFEYSIEDDPATASFYAAFQFSSESRDGNSETVHGANIQLISMVYDENERQWLVDGSEITRDVELGENQMILQ